VATSLADSIAAAIEILRFGRRLVDDSRGRSRRRAGLEQSAHRGELRAGAEDVVDQPPLGFTGGSVSQYFGRKRSGRLSCWLLCAPTPDIVAPKSPERRRLRDSVRDMGGRICGVGAICQPEMAVHSASAVPGTDPVIKCAGRRHPPLRHEARRDARIARVRGAAVIALCRDRLPADPKRRISDRCRYNYPG